MILRHQHATGILRREFLQVGFSAWLGLQTMPLLAARQARAATTGTGRARSLILAFLTGGLSHIDSFDPKPDAPEGIRGPFQTIDTRAPGLAVTQHLPGLAQRSQHIALVRSLTHSASNHLNATHALLTGHPQPGAFFDKIASRDDYPCYASALQFARPTQGGRPGGVMLPTFLMENSLIWPGQHAGFLGAALDPWQIRSDPNKPDFRVESLELPVGYTLDRLDSRRALSEAMAAHEKDFLGQATRDSFSAQQALATQLLTTSAVTEAFRLDRESDATRDRYGRHMFGQSLLLARRLVEAEVPVIQVNMGRAQTWDTHNDNFETLEKRLLPPLDQGLSALLDDLAASGRLDETLVVVAGEFGRTPKIGKGISGGAGANPTGRDHWPAVFSAMLAGGGVGGGRIIGSSDRSGAHPADQPCTPADLAATIYSALGVPLDLELRDRLNRPLRLTTGQPIAGLF